MHRMGGVGGRKTALLKYYFNCASISRGMSHLANISARNCSGGLIPFQIALPGPVRTGLLSKRGLIPHSDTAAPAFSTGHWPLSSSIQRRNLAALIAPPMQIVHRNVQVHFAAGRLDADHQRLGVRASRQPFVVHVDFRRKHFEVKPLVIQPRHRIPDDHIRQLADRFPHHLLTRFNFHARELAGHFDRHFRRQIQNHAPFNVSLDGDERRHTLPAIRIFLHRQVHDFRRRLQRFREDRIRGVDERLDQFHSHERCSPASATGAPTALGSSLSTYRRISYSTSGFTGFCTKCFAPFCSAARIFSWYPTDDTMTMRASACWRTMRSTASMPSICGMVMSMSTMSGFTRLNSAMAVRPSPASPATSPPNCSIILMRFLRAKTESSTTR